MSQRVTLDVIIKAPVEAVFAGLTDWEGQGLWMVGTRVAIVSGDGRSVGSELQAVTGVGPVAVVDTMTITCWDRPRLVEVLHTGSVVAGTGRMEVLELPRGLSRLIWQEDLELPLGVVGRLGWPVVKPGFAAGVRRSLRTFARLVETGVLPRDPRHQDADLERPA